MKNVWLPYFLVLVHYIAKLIPEGCAIMASALYCTIPNFILKLVTSCFRHVLIEYIERRRSGEADVAKLECNVKSIVKIIQNR